MRSRPEDIGCTYKSDQLDHKHKEHGSQHAVISHNSLSQVLKIMALQLKHLPWNYQRLPGPIGADNQCNTEPYPNLDGSVENAALVACTVLCCY
jgi:hypothetical protein